MSAPGDVLAVMDDVAHALNHTKTAPERNALIEARAAVAELIDAAREAKDLLELVCMIDPSTDPQEGSIGHKLRAALAQVQP